MLNNFITKKDYVKKTIYVNGMTCAHCAQSLKKALENIKEITIVNVSLDDHTATIMSKTNISEKIIISTIENTGYSVVKII
jgi:copper chaperone